MKYSRLQAGVLAILLVQNASYTLMRRYSIGVRRDSFSSHECLALAEVFKLVLSLYKIHKDGDWRRGGGDFGKYIRGVLMDSSKVRGVDNVEIQSEQAKTNTTHACTHYHAHLTHTHTPTHTNTHQHTPTHILTLSLTATSIVRRCSPSPGYTP